MTIPQQPQAAPAFLGMAPPGSMPGSSAAPQGAPTPPTATQNQVFFSPTGRPYAWNTAKASSRWLKRANSGGCDDWEVFSHPVHGEYIASRSSVIPAVWANDLWKPPPPPPLTDAAAEGSQAEEEEEEEEGSIDFEEAFKELEDQPTAVAEPAAAPKPPVMAEPAAAPKPPAVAEPTAAPKPPAMVPEPAATPKPPTVAPADAPKPPAVAEPAAAPKPPAEAPAPKPKPPAAKSLRKSTGLHAAFAKVAKPEGHGAA